MSDDRRTGQERRLGERRHDWRRSQADQFLHLLNDLDALLDAMQVDEGDNPTMVWQERLDTIVRAYRHP